MASKITYNNLSRSNGHAKLYTYNIYNQKQSKDYLTCFVGQGE